MKRKKAGVYLNQQSDEYLEYHSQEQYYRDCQLLLTLPEDELVLLKHMRCFMHFIENLVDEVYRDLSAKEGMSALEIAMFELDTNDAAAPREKIDIDTVLSIAWNWHNDVSDMKRDMTGLYANTIYLSWSGFCKIYHLSIVSQPEEHANFCRHAREFSYFSMIQQEANGVIPPLTINRYKMTQLWDSMRQIVPTLYIYSYKQDMRDYVNALFFRYCDFFCTEQLNLPSILDNPLFFSIKRPLRNNNNNIQAVEGGGDEEEEEADDADDYDAYRKDQTPLDSSGTYFLQSEYFFEGEILFFSQLRRMRLCRRLEVQYEANPIILRDEPSKETMVKCNTVLIDMLCSVSKHKYLRQFIVEDFKKAMMSLYVYHGEKERYTRRHPSSSNEPGDVLSVCRPAAHLSANNIQKMKLDDIIKHNHEKEIILIAKCVTHRWICYHSGRAISRYLNRSRDELQGFIIEEMVSLESINDLITDNEESDRGMYPTLLKLVHTYYVLFKSRVYKSEHFTDSYLVWLQLLLSERFITPALIHPNISKMLHYFVPT